MLSDEPEPRPGIRDDKHEKEIVADNARPP
ncbi:hypothetical protein DFP86_115106 [Paludibacterium purpuratum]|uniref:Uncharacterized protein n=1 Tax=Paludibacterium purpuratum TaxID=1144873 RepID=A0A4R7AZH6_9NEIS|nr:hypothetical protein DFP86_115106 [Paludibacterium purpuratum]